MRHTIFATLLSVMLIAVSTVAAQAPESKDEQQLLALIKEVQAQQAQITENQAEIDKRLAEVSELIRVARILAGKIGK